MSRVAILASHGRRIISPAYATQRASVLVADRVANGDAFPDEMVVRLPRRISRALLNEGRLSWGYVGRLLRSAS